MTGVKVVPGPISFRSDAAAESLRRIFGAMMMRGFRKLRTIWERKKRGGGGNVDITSTNLLTKYQQSRGISCMETSNEVIDIRQILVTQ